MDNQFYNGFCPNCGALLRDGKCPSCGFGENPANEETDTAGTENVNVENNGGMTGNTSDEGQKPRNYELYQNNYMNNGNYTDNTNYNNAQDGYQQSGMNQNAYYQNGAGQNGYYQNGTGQNGYYQNGTGQNGYYQNGAGQNGYYQNGTGQNQYYQNGNMQGGYYQQNGNGYYGQPPRKKSSKGGVIAAVIGGILLLLLIIAALVMVFVAALGAKSDAEDNYSYDYDYDDYDYDYDDYDDYDYDDDYDDYDDDYDDLLAFVDDIDWDDEDWKEEPYNYDPDEVGDDYYYELVNCIDESVSYQMVHENYEELDEDRNICIRINYYQIEGDIPNLEVINETLKEQAMWAGERFHEEKEDFEFEFENYGEGYVAEVESYVTYNDEQTISVVSDIYYESATEVKKSIHAVNVDVETGTILNNTDILDISDEFLEDYRDICEDQNGTVAAMNIFDNDELKEFFESEDDLIIYYNPCGLEVGINYETEERYGWVTATLTDYEQYMMSY